MEKYYHRRFINFDICAVRYFGLWSPFIANSTTIKELLYTGYRTIMTFSMFIFLTTVIADLLLNIDDFMIVAEDACFFTGFAPIFVKHVTYNVYRRRVIKLMDEVYGTVDDLVKCTDEGVIKVVAAATFYVKLEKYVFWCCGSIMVTGFLAVPSVNGSLPIRAEYFFDTTDGLKHNIALAIQVTGVIASVVGIKFMDSTVIHFCFYTVAQLKLLDSNYQHCQLTWPRASFYQKVTRAKDPNAEISTFVPFSPAEVIETNDSFRKRFIACIRHHHRLSNIIDDINDFYGNSLFAQLCASCSMICLIGFRLSLGVEDFNLFMKYINFLVTAFSQKLIMCWVGNMLLYQSLELADSPWFSNWENEKYSNLAYLVIVSIKRGQKGLTLKAANFYTMSLATFVMILRASYSFFALLTAVTED